jgi:hypothetical protein
MSIDPDTQRGYTAIQRSFIDTDRAPHYTELARTLGVDVEEERRLQREAVVAGVGAWFIADTDTVESFAPFHNVPTTVRVSVDGEQRWFAQCGLEALAMRWVFPGSEVRIDARCLDCTDSIVVVMRDEEILEVTPDTAVGHFNPPLNAELREGMFGSFL